MPNLPRRRVTHPKGSPLASPRAVVQKHMQKEADINVIVERARRGIAPANMRSPGVYADVSNMPKDLTEAFAQVDRAWESFMALPAKAREELGNDPRRLTRVSREFFERHGLLSSKEALASPPEPPQGSGGVAPGKTSKKSSKAKAEPIMPSSDEDDQE